jgi:hypothetical protein
MRTAQETILPTVLQGAILLAQLLKLLANYTESQRTAKSFWQDWVDLLSSQLEAFPRYSE